MKTAIGFVVLIVLIATAKIWGKGLIALVLHLGITVRALWVIIPVLAIVIFIIFIIIVVVRGRNTAKRIRSFSPAGTRRVR